MKLQKNIVILDDDIDSIRFIKKILENAGHRVHESQNHEDFMKIMKEVGPHLAIIDYNLGPGHPNGISILKEIKNEHTLKSIPIVILSANLKKNVIIAATQYGAEQVISKPIVTMTFLQKIKKTLKENTFPTLRFDKARPLKARSQGEITKISELGVSILSGIKLKGNQPLEIESEFLKRIKCHTCRFTTYKEAKVVSPGEYQNRVNFKGLSDETAKTIRQMKVITKK